MDLRDIYLEEAEELLNLMEDTMLLLENSPEDQSHVAEMFRNMHTLKGTSSMYGSNNVADFIHDLETIYDNVRSGELALTKEIIESTFESLDHLKRIVKDPNIEDKKDQKVHKDLTGKIKAILNENSGKAAKKANKISEIVSEEKTYKIYFEPNEDIFLDGTNPILLVDELSELGKAKVFAYMRKEVTSESFDPEKCYTSWDIILSSKSGENEIRDVFIFVEDISKVEVETIAETDLFSIPAFLEALPDKSYPDRPLATDELISIADHAINNEDEEAEVSSASPAEEKPEKVVDNTRDDEVEDEEEEDKEQDSSSASDQQPSRASAQNKSISSIRVTSDKLDELMNQVSELITAQAGLSLYAQNNYDPALEVISENVEKLSRTLRDIAFGMTLIKINNLFGRFQRTVRDVSKSLGKSVDFITEGGETEIDKKIIESLSDPLMHLIRNCLDHGIETADERAKKGKSRKGTIKLRSYYSGAKVYIVVEDDGKGLDTKKIKKKAIEKKLIGKEDNLSEKEVYDLIFQPGFSTAQNVTDLSGRGVGMDVVKKNILDIRGDITVESTKDVGTKIILSLPLTLSVIDGLLVKIQETFFVIPLGVVKKCFQIPRSKLNNDFNQLIVLDEEQIPYLDLRKEFKMLDDEVPEMTSLVVIQNEGKKMGICVDRIDGEYQAVLKPVGKYYRNQEFVAGATILGDGSIALVLDTYKIIAGKLTKHKISA